MTQLFLEAFQWHGVKRGEAFAFYAGDIESRARIPSAPAGQSGMGAPAPAMYTDSIEQLRALRARGRSRSGPRPRSRRSPPPAAAAGSCSGSILAEGAVAAHSCRSNG